MRTILFISVLLGSHLVISQSADWEQKADSIVDIAQAQLGTPYKWATSLPNVSFDCSGFTYYAYSQIESIEASRSSSAYAELGESVPLAECRKGDCIVFAGTAPGSKTPGHVGIVLSNNEDGIKFIHCSSSKKHFGVVITDYYSSGYSQRFLDVRRLF